MADPVELPGDLRPLEDGDEHVALSEYGGSLGSHEPVTVNVDQFRAFVERCEEMGWENVRMYVRDNSLLLGREQGDDGDLFVALAPMLVGGNEDI